MDKPEKFTIPLSFLETIFENLTILAIMLSSENPYNPTQAEIQACEVYAGDKLTTILEEWVEVNHKPIPVEDDLDKGH